MVTTSRDRIARVWRPDTGELVHSLEEHRGVVTSATFTPDGRLIVTTSRDGGARVWDVETGLADRRRRACERGLERRPQLRRPAYGHRQPRRGRRGLGNLHREARGLSAGHADAVNGADFSEDATRVVTASEDGTARVWDVTIGPVLEPIAFLGSATRAVFTPDGQLILATPTKGRPRLLEADGGEPTTWIEHNAATSAAVSHAGALAATADADEIRLWTLPDASPVRILSLPAAAVAVEFDPSDETIVVAGDDGVARILDAESGAERIAFRDGEEMIADASFSPDGSRLATAGDDGIARIWDSNNGELLLELKGT